MSRSIHDRKRSQVDKYLHGIIVQGSAPRLPSLRQISQHYGLPLKHVQQIVGDLKREGLVKAAPRRGITLVSKEVEPGPPLPSISAVDSLLRTMRARIETGAYRSGQALPKTSYLAASERVSSHTVGRVYRLLQKDGLVHMKGRARIVGDAGQSQSGAMPAFRKSILMVQLNDPSWEEFAHSWWAQPFAQAFMREMSLYGFEPVTILLREMKQGSNPTGIPGGKRAIRDKIEQLDSRLAGILVVNMGQVSFRRLDSDLLDALSWLCSFGVIVIAFDPLNEAIRLAPDGSRNRRFENMVAQPDVNKYFVRAYIDHRKAAETALAALHRLGHRSVGYPVPPDPPLWVQHRLFDIRKCAEAMNEPMRIIDSRDEPPLFEYNATTTVAKVAAMLRDLRWPLGRRLAQILDDLQQPDTPCSGLAPACQDLLNLTASAGALVGRSDVTALVAPNDEYARKIFRWLTVLGVDVPERLSLISFDDRQEMLYPYTISSVNFGFDGLGYTAFHLILGDIPVKVDKERSLAANSRINHPATLGPARPARTWTVAAGREQPLLRSWS
jgi:DNA-binding LacI/PurR family transcriptional regulator/DNA-binding transcriptional regulator YhcF (GntR family)